MTSLLGMTTRDHLAIAADGRSTDGDGLVHDLVMKTARLNNDCCLGMSGKGKWRVPIAVRLLEHLEWEGSDNIFERWDASGEELRFDYCELKERICELIKKRALTIAGVEGLSILLGGVYEGRWRLCLWESKESYEIQERVSDPKNIQFLGGIAECTNKAHADMMKYLYDNRLSMEERLVLGLKASARGATAKTDYGVPIVNEHILVRSSVQLPRFSGMWE